MAEEYAKQKAQEDYERRIFEKFHKKPPVAEQKSIRKVYMELSKKFHPDLAKTKQEETRFNEIMVRINRAYEIGDIAKLLEIRDELKQYSSDTHNTEQDTPSLSFINHEIAKVKHELDLIKGQLKRSRGELAELRASEAGMLLADYKRYKKEGYDLIDEMRFEIEEEVDALQTMLKGLDKYAQTGKMPFEVQMMMGMIDIDVRDFF